MNPIKINSTLNVLEIIDDAKKQRNSLLLVMGFNLPNLLFNSDKIFEKGFNFSHVFLIIFGIALIKFLLDLKNKTVSKVIAIDEVGSYTYKKSFWNTSESIILQLKDGKKRYISIFSKNQLEEFESLLNKLNIKKC